MSQVLSTRLADETAERLKRFARRLGKTPSETGAMLIEESLRETEFAHIEFRNSSVGRQPYLKGSGLAVWEVIMVAKSYGMDCEKVTAHFRKPLEWVKAAFNYADAYPEEIRLAIEDYEETTPTTLQRMFPELQILTVPKEVLEEDREKR